MKRLLSLLMHPLYCLVYELALMPWLSRGYGAVPESEK